GRFRTRVVRTYSLLIAMNDVFVKGILYVGRGIGGAEQALIVRLVLSKEQLRLSLADQPALAVLKMSQFDRRHSLHIRFAQGRLRIVVVPPGPAIAKPDGGQKIKKCWLWTTIERGDQNQYVFYVRLSVFDKDIEVTIVFEYSRIDQIKLRVLPAAATVFF